MPGRYEDAPAAYTAVREGVEEKAKKCIQCQGEGTLKATHGPGGQVDVKCPRCHGAKDGQIEIYG